MELFVEIYLRDSRPPQKRNKSGRRKLHGGTKAINPDTPTYLRFEGQGLAGALQELEDWIGDVESADRSVRRRFARARVIGPGDPKYEDAKRSWQTSR